MDGKRFMTDDWFFNYRIWYINTIFIRNFIRSRIWTIKYAGLIKNNLCLLFINLNSTFWTILVENNQISLWQFRSFLFDWLHDLICL